MCMLLVQFLDYNIIDMKSTNNIVKGELFPTMHENAPEVSQ
jgi:hypothetical protein